MTSDFLDSFRAMFSVKFCIKNLYNFLPPHTQFNMRRLYEKGTEAAELSGSTTDLSVTLSSKLEVLGDNTGRLPSGGEDFGEKTEDGLKGNGVTDRLLSSELSLSLHFRERLSFRSNSLSSFSSSLFLPFASYSS